MLNGRRGHYSEINKNYLLRVPNLHEYLYTIKPWLQIPLTDRCTKQQNLLPYIASIKGWHSQLLSCSTETIFKHHIQDTKE